MERAAALGVPVHLASGAVLGELSETVTPQGVVAVCDVLDVALARALELSRDADVPALFVLLAAVRDPGNAGTVLRTADAAGASAVVFSDNSVDPYNGKCVRASAGSVFHLPIVVGEPVVRCHRRVAIVGAPGFRRRQQGRRGQPRRARSRWPARRARRHGSSGMRHGDFRPTSFKRLTSRFAFRSTAAPRA